MPNNINPIEEPTEPPSGCISSSPSISYGYYTYTYGNSSSGSSISLSSSEIEEFNLVYEDFNFEYKEPTLIEHYKRRNNKLSGLVEFCKTHYRGG